MTTLAEKLIEKINHLDEANQQQVLEFVETIEARQTSQQVYSARELMRLPFEIRNRLAQDALERSFEDDVELLETFDEADFYDE